MKECPGRQEVTLELRPPAQARHFCALADGQSDKVVARMDYGWRACAW